MKNWYILQLVSCRNFNFRFSNISPTFALPIRKLLSGKTFCTNSCVIHLSPWHLIILYYFNFIIVNTNGIWKKMFPKFWNTQNIFQTRWFHFSSCRTLICTVRFPRTGTFQLFPSIISKCSDFSSFSNFSHVHCDTCRMMLRYLRARYLPSVSTMLAYAKKTFLIIRSIFMTFSTIVLLWFQLTIFFKLYRQRTSFSRFQTIGFFYSHTVYEDNIASWIFCLNFFFFCELFFIFAVFFLQLLIHFLCLKKLFCKINSNSKFSSVLFLKLLQAKCTSPEVGQRR